MGRKLSRKALSPAYVLVLGLLAVATISTYFVVQGRVRRRLDDTALIGLIGRQRLHAREVGQAALLLERALLRERSEEAGPWLEELERAVEILHGDAGALLQRGNGAQGSSSLLAQPDLAPMLASVQRWVRGTLDDARTLLATSPAVPEPTVSPEIVRKTEALIADLDRLLAAMTARSESGLAGLQDLQLVLLALELSLLLAMGVFILRPLERRVDSQFAELTVSRAEQGRHAAIVESSGDAIISHDLAGHVTSWNSGAERVYGYRTEEILGRHVSILAPLRERAEIREVLGRVGRGETIRVQEAECIRKDGSVVYVSLTTSPVRDPDGRVVEASTISRDVSEHKQAEQALRDSEQRYALAAEGAKDVLWEWDLRAGTALLSERWDSLLGHDPEPAARTIEVWFGRVHADDRERLVSDFEDLREGRSERLENEHRLRHRNGSSVWVLCRGAASRDASGRAVRMAGSLTDVTHHHLTEDRLRRSAYFDDLTGLPNRAQFTEALRDRLETKRRSGDDRFAVLFLDLDRFKLVNDSFGHRAGDLLLEKVARSLEANLRPGDMIARLGGDEYAILASGVADAAEAARIGKRIQTVFRNPFDVAGKRFFTSASVGIAIPRGDVGPADILRDADTAMYQAKKRGRGRCAVFEPHMHTQALRELSLETDLRQAIEHGELRLAYQPIVSLETGAIAGFEALLRWQHPERGLLGPMEFLPLAEETDLIQPIDRWVLEQACRQLRSWRAAARGTLPSWVNVNLSGREFRSNELLPYLDDLLEETGLEPRCLNLEVTERVIMENDSLRELLESIETRGIGTQIDDFGTGYSSLSALCKLPFRGLKIDRSFVGRIGSESEDRGMVRTIVAVARNMGMQSTAEGVETEEQLGTLRSLGCQYAQGYFLAQPLGAKQAGRLLEAAPCW